MTSPPAVAVWSPWRLHADAVTLVLTEHGISSEVVDDPVATAGLLVAELVGAGDLDVLEARRRGDRPTVVWGGTLPEPRVAALRDAGAAAYVSGLHAPRDLASVVRQVQEGQRVGWSGAAVPVEVLTSREREVAQAYLVQWADRTRAEVATRLGMSERTLKVHIANIRAKAGHRGTATRDGLLRTLTVRGWIG
ncbi:helix-turn-helix transcriptional regulator [Janibacter anophelis]|uniref:helix-turn-helix transcriptional regulator n=1 Tax=Janibacter anophelis TaxID=319054 RepID=UPI000DEFF754|nr:LuxR C-terminal-related transcriptional regulator [Janibacter anophelis]